MTPFCPNPIFDEEPIDLFPNMAKAFVQGNMNVFGNLGIGIDNTQYKMRLNVGGIKPESYGTSASVKCDYLPSGSQEWHNLCCQNNSRVGYAHLVGMSIGDSSGTNDNIYYGIVGKNSGTSGGAYFVIGAQDKDSSGSWHENVRITPDNGNVMLGIKDDPGGSHALICKNSESIPSLIEGGSFFVYNDKCYASSSYGLIDFHWMYGEIQSLRTELNSVRSTAEQAISIANAALSAANSG